MAEQEKLPENKQGKAEYYFESFLWNSRFIVLLAVIASLVMAVGLFYLTSVDVYYTLSHLTHYRELTDAERVELKAATIAHVVGSVDGFY